MEDKHRLLYMNYGYDYLYYRNSKYALTFDK